MSQILLHVTSGSTWAAAQEKRQLQADSLSQEGFIHCSMASQVLRVANNLFTGQHGLVLVVINPEQLTSELRWEPGFDIETELFPHIYGPINLDAVMEVLDFEPDAFGRFALPESRKFNPDDE